MRLWKITKRLISNLPAPEEGSAKTARSKYNRNTKFRFRHLKSLSPEANFNIFTNNFMKKGDKQAAERTILTALNRLKLNLRPQIPFASCGFKLDSPGKIKSEIDENFGYLPDQAKLIATLIHLGRNYSQNAVNLKEEIKQENKIKNAKKAEKAEKAEESDQTQKDEIEPKPIQILEEEQSSQSNDGIDDFMMNVESENNSKKDAFDILDFIMESSVTEVGIRKVQIGFSSSSGGTSINIPMPLTERQMTNMTCKRILKNISARQERTTVGRMVGEFNDILKGSSKSVTDKHMIEKLALQSRLSANLLRMK